MQVEYAKADVDDILIQISVSNRGPETASIRVLPTVWFRNTWSWAEHVEKPRLAVAGGKAAGIVIDEPKYGRMWLHCGGDPTLLFTENETNTERVFGSAGGPRYAKDAFDRYVVAGRSPTR